MRVFYDEKLARSHFFLHREGFGGADKSWTLRVSGLSPHVPVETRELAVEAVAARFSLTEAAELAGCSRTAVVNWAKAAASPRSPEGCICSFDRKMGLVARLEAGSGPPTSPPRPASPAATVSGCRRRPARKGRSPRDRLGHRRRAGAREAPSSSGSSGPLRAGAERNAVSRGRSMILKRPGADLSALTAAERRRWLTGSGGASGCGRRWRRCPRYSTFYDRLAAASAPDPAPPCGLVGAAFEASAPTATAASAPSSRGAPARRSGPAAQGSTRRGRWRSPRWCAGSRPRRLRAPAPRG